MDFRDVKLHLLLLLLEFVETVLLEGAVCLTASCDVCGSLRSLLSARLASCLSGAGSRNIFGCTVAQERKQVFHAIVGFPVLSALREPPVTPLRRQQVLDFFFVFDVPN